MHCNQTSTTTCSLVRVDTWHSRQTSCTSLRRPGFLPFFSLAFFFIFSTRLTFYLSALYSILPGSHLLFDLLISEPDFWPVINTHMHIHIKKSSHTHIHSRTKWTIIRTCQNAEKNVNELIFNGREDIKSFILSISRKNYSKLHGMHHIHPRKWCI